MREHPANAAIQRKACARLLDLTPSVQGAEFQRIRCETGACAALLNIGTSNRDRQQRIKRAGAAEQVGRAMAASNATDDTKKWGQMLLDRLANT